MNSMSLSTCYFALLKHVHTYEPQDQKMYGIEKIRKILMLFSAFTIVEYDGNAGYQGIPLTHAGKQEGKAHHRHLQIALIFQEPGHCDGKDTDRVIIGFHEFCQQAENCCHTDAQ